MKTIDDIAGEIRDEFAFLDDWESRYAHIIDLGKGNPPLAEAERNEATRVRGCASQVWLVADDVPGQPDRIAFRAESDAMIVSGLIALLIRLFSGQPASDILGFDAKAYFDEIGVSGALSAQRSNGLASMLQRIRAYADGVRA